MVKSEETIKHATTTNRGLTKQTFSHLMRNSIPTEAGKFHLVIPEGDTVRSITNILSSNECNAIINATCTSKEGFSRPSGFLKESRDCQRIHTIDKTMSAIMMTRLTQYLPEIVVIDGVRWRRSRFTHHWRYVRYYPGGHFSTHYDGVKMSDYPTPCMSIFTVQIYLNGSESFKGGSTRFYPDYVPVRKESHEIGYGFVSKFDPFSAKDARRFDVEAETGKALIFNHAANTLHDASAVTEGVKFIMRGDILYTAVQEDIHILPTVDVNSGSVDCDTCWCPFTAEKHGTRNYVGEVWYCICANDMHGAKLDDGDVTPQDGDTTRNDANTTNKCWHNNDDMVSNHLSRSLTTNFDEQTNPKIIVLISGKRASGKDFIANLLHESLACHRFTVHRTALGDINKKLYADSVGISAERLMNDRDFKEQHRVAMVEQHNQRNNEDPEWCVKAVLKAAASADILLLSDLRTLADLILFQQTGKRIISLRISASEEAREERGWKPCPIKDNLYTETDLDLYSEWTACWDNSNNSSKGKEMVQNWIDFTVLPRIVDTLPK